MEIKAQTQTKFLCPLTGAERDTPHEAATIAFAHLQGTVRDKIANMWRHDKETVRRQIDETFQQLRDLRDLNEQRFPPKA